MLGAKAKTVTASVAGFDYLELWPRTPPRPGGRRGAEGYPVFADARVLCSTAP